MTADDLTINGNLSGTGTLTLQPYAVDRVVNINRNNDDGSSFHLNTAELSRLVDGWGLINVGRTNSTALNFYGVSAWRDAVTVRNGTGSTYIDGAMTGTDDAAFTFTGSTYFRDGAVTTAGQNVTFNSHLTFENGGTINTNGGTLTVNGLFRLRNFNLNPVSITTAGGNINLNGTLIESGNTAGKTLTLNAGTGAVNFGNTVDGAYNLNATGGAITFNGAWGNTTPLGTVSLTSGSSLSLPSITANSIFARANGATSDITLASGNDLISNGTGGITLVAARNFINQSGADALTSNNGGRWLVYSTDVTGTIGEEDLAANFNRYSCTYGGTCPTLGTGNGFLYSYAPVLTITPTIITTIYGDTLTGLNGYSYNISGYNGSDGSNDIVTGTLNGTTGYIVGNDVGAYDINYANGTLVSSLGYSFAYADKTNGITVTARTLTAALTGTVEKVYDGYNNATLTIGNYTLSNIFNGDDVALGNITSGTYGDQNVGNGKNISVNGLSLSGTKAGNYVLASNTVSGNVGKVTPKGLTVTATAGQNKTYGAGNTTLGYNYTGLVGTDTSATFSGALGRAAGENAGIYAINQGTLSASGNYAVTSFVSNDYTINKAVISITGPNGSRNYGYDNPNYNWSNATITGLQYGENGSVLDNLTFNVAGSATSTANAGTSHAINLGSFSDNNYTLGSYTAGTLSITKAQLTIVADSKVRLVVMPQPDLTASFFGLRNGETESVVSGLMLSSNANANSPIGTYTITASGGHASNYNINYVSGTLLVTPGALPTTVLNPAGITATPSNPNSNNDPLQTTKDSKDGPAPVAKWEEPLTKAYVGNDPLVTFTPELREMLGMGV